MTSKRDLRNSIHLVLGVTALIVSSPGVGANDAMMAESSGVTRFAGPFDSETVSPDQVPPCDTDTPRDIGAQDTANDMIAAAAFLDAGQDDGVWSPDDRPVVIASNELSEERGGQAINVASQTLMSSVQGNAFNGTYNAGNVSLLDNALSSFNGIGSVLINTGAQVSLQSGINLVINVNP
jgi:hypothetical protein